MKTDNGFTLIEIIITLTLLAIAGAAFVSVIGKSFTQSGLPAGMVREQYVLIQEMEKITSEYRRQVDNGTITTQANLVAFKTDHVDTSPYVDATNTKLTTLTDGTYTTQNVLLVTLRKDNQTLQSFFTY